MVKEIIEYQNLKTLLLDEDKLQDVLTHVFGVSKMFALFLKEDEEFGLDSKFSSNGQETYEQKRRMAKMVMFDQILKAFLLLQ